MKTSSRKLEVWIAPAILIVLHALLFWLAVGGAVAGYSDFTSLYSAGHILKNGWGSRLYDDQTQEQVQAQLFPRIYAGRGPLFFNHLPFEGLLFVPLAYLSYVWAYIVWAAVNLLILFLLPFLLAGSVPNLKSEYRPFLLLSFLSFFPVFVAVLQGQDSVLLLLLFSCVFVMLRQGRELSAGCFLALALFKFQYVLPFLLLYAVKRHWKFLLGFCVVTVVLVLASLAITGWSGSVRYVTFLRGLNPDMSAPADEPTHGTYPNMPNLRGLLDAVGVGRFSEAHIKLGTTMASALLLLWVSARGRGSLSGEPNAVDLTFALNLSVALLVSYHLHLHDLSLLALPIVLVLNYLAGRPTPLRAVRWDLPGISVLFYMTPLYLFLLQHGQMHLLVWPLLIFTFMVAGELSRLEKQSAKHAS